MSYKKSIISLPLIYHAFNKDFCVRHFVNCYFAGIVTSLLLHRCINGTKKKTIKNKPAKKNDLSIQLSVHAVTQD